MADEAHGSLEDAAHVRAVLARELETISHYEAMARTASGAEVRDFLLHLAAEEKEHVAEAMAVLTRLDQVQAGHLSRPVPRKHFENPPAPAGRPPSSKLPAATVSRPARDVHDPRLAADPHLVMYSQPAPTEHASELLTVGHLKGQPL